MVRESDATMQLTPQDNQLMSKHRILSFKPQLRLEWRGQDGQNETERAARSFRQLRGFRHGINPDKVFGTHKPSVVPLTSAPTKPRSLTPNRTNELDNRGIRALCKRGCGKAPDQVARNTGRYSDRMDNARLSSAQISWKERLWAGHP
jgi:hypothetical protein